MKKDAAGQIDKGGARRVILNRSKKKKREKREKDEERNKCIIYLVSRKRIVARRARV